MSANYHTPLPTGTALEATSELFNSRFGELDAAITDLATDGEIDQITAPAATTLTISSGAVTRTQMSHIVDTEGGGSADDLTTINGGSDGQLLIIRILNGARVVTVKHGTGNVWLANGADRVMADTALTLMLLYISSLAKWVEINPGTLAVWTRLAPTALGLTGIILPDRSLVGNTTGQRRLALMPSPEAANWLRVRAAAATVQPIGVAAPTVANSPANANDADGSFITLPTTASSGNIGGLVSATFNLVRRQWNPTFYARVKTPADITSIRYWIGLCSADVTNVDTLAGATEFAGFRFSTVAGDTVWRAITKDASTQSVGTLPSAVAANTVYELRVRFDSAAGKAYFSVDGSSEAEVTANLPQAATDLGFCVRCITQTAGIRQINFSDLYVEMR